MLDYHCADRAVRSAGWIRALLVFLVMSLAFACLAGPLGAGAKAATFAFPSDSSSIVSSGTPPAGQVGYFWSVTRGDKASETFPGPPQIDHVELAVQPTTNSLSPSAEVDWTLSINGTDVGSLVVPAKTTAPIALERSFAPIAGPSYAVVLRVTNEVPGGQGSIALAASNTAGAHSIEISDVAPDTVINSGPTVTTTATSASFAFASPQADTTGFKCALDHAALAPCGSPKEYSALALGAHYFEVAAVDSAGNTDPTPAAWLWLVVAPPHKAALKKCKRGYKKVKKHGKAVCVKKHKKHHHGHH